jgi:pSer/pThr/pTyr-binding forkhead associated (FHA) protein
MEESVPFLVSTTGPIQGKRFPITAEGITLGREAGVDVVIPSEGVSRLHARVLLHNGAVWVQDQGSRNGVFVNEKRVVRHKQLSPGDSLTVGEQTFAIEVTVVSSDPLETVPTQETARPTPLPPARSPFLRGPIGATLVVGALLLVAAFVLLVFIR